MSEARFAELLSNFTRPFQSSVARVLREPPEQWTEPFLYGLYRQATDAETFLDDHGAKRSLTFYQVREAVARVRWLSLAASAFAHLTARLPSYRVPDSEALQRELGAHLQDLVRRLGGMLVAASQSLEQQWLRSECLWNEEAQEGEEGPQERWTLRADRPLEAIESEDESGQTRAARFLGRFVRLSEAWAPEARIRRRGQEELTAFMASYCPEPLARMMEARAHSLQSDFDTHLRESSEVEEFPGLMTLRSSVSQCFHLLEAVTALTHLYERHWLHEKDRSFRESLEEIAPRMELLDLIVNGCVIRAYRCLHEHARLAEELLQQFARPTERKIPLPAGVDLHARPLTLIVALVNHHKTPVQMILVGQPANAASILSLLLLVGAHPGQREVSFRGSKEVLDDIQLLIEYGLGENGQQVLPERLRTLLRL